MKQEWTMRIYKADKRLTKPGRSSRNQVGWRCVGTYEFVGRDQAGMDREVRELKHLYPEPQFKFECNPTYVTKTNMMSGIEYQERYDTPNFCSPSSESYWSM